VECCIQVVEGMNTCVFPSECLAYTSCLHFSTLSLVACIPCPPVFSMWFLLMDGRCPGETSLLKPRPLIFSLFLTLFKFTQYYKPLFPHSQWGHNVFCWKKPKTCPFFP
jgi:hypothetical protein